MKKFATNGLPVFSMISLLFVLFWYTIFNPWANKCWNNESLLMGLVVIFLYLALLILPKLSILLFIFAEKNKKSVFYFLLSGLSIFMFWFYFNGFHLTGCSV